MSRILAVSLLGVVALANGAGSAGTRVAFRLEPGGAILIKVGVGDLGPTTFLLDTGSNRSVISATVANRLSLPPVARTQVVSSAGGSSMQPVVRLPSLTVGHIQQSGLLATVLDPAQLRALAGEADGVLGMDFLIDRQYTLDFDRRHLLWGASSIGRNRRAIRLTMRRSEGRCLVALPQGAGEPPLWFVPDSGAAIVVLFGRRSPGALAGVPIGGLASLEAVGGRQSVVQVLLPELKLGDIVLRNVRALQLTGIGHPGVEGDGLLPLHLFGQVLFDPDRDQVTVVAR